ncbi:hypothetical protein [Endozoicomonas lisbonensis]|uniref:Uncharacterized protein n=1 Tax=Endozoicomonas lisbonensis TaxID=3120522 RepID=A0ABV2SEP2_9GAMM
MYTAVEIDLLARYKKAFEKDNPDVRILWVRDSIGVMTAKLLAEEYSPARNLALCRRMHP